MINLNLTLPQMLTLLGIKEAQVYQQSLEIDRLTEELKVVTFDNSKLLVDRDMDALELMNLRTKISRITMMAEKAG